MYTGERLIAVFAGLVVLAVAACGGDDDDGAGSADTQGVQGEAGLCADLAAVNASLEKVQQISGSTDVSQVQQVRNDLNLALTELQEAGEELTTAQSANLQDTFETFNADVDKVSESDVNPDQSLGDEAATVRASGQAVQSAVQEIESTSECQG